MGEDSLIFAARSKRIPYFLMVKMVKNNKSHGRDLKKIFLPNKKHYSVVSDGNGNLFSSGSVDFPKFLFEHGIFFKSKLILIVSIISLGKNMAHKLLYQYQKKYNIPWNCSFVQNAKNSNFVLPATNKNYLFHKIYSWHPNKILMWW